MNWVDPWGLSASDGKNNSTAVSTGFHIPGLLPTIPQVNVTNSKVLNYGIAIGASALNLVSSAGNFYFLELIMRTLLLIRRSILRINMFHLGSR